MNKLRYLLVTIGLLSVTSLGSIALPSPTLALFEDAKNEACEGIKLGDPSAADCGTDSESKLDAILETGLNIFSLVVGIIAVIMLMVNGIKFITSQGEAQHVSSARSGIIYAVVGLVVVALAQFIVRFVLSSTQTP